MGDAKQTQWGEQQVWGMNESKKRMIGTVPFGVGVVEGVSATGIMNKTIGFHNRGVEASSVANVSIDASRKWREKWYL